MRHIGIIADQSPFFLPLASGESTPDREGSSLGLLFAMLECPKYFAIYSVSKGLIN